MPRNLAQMLARLRLRHLVVIDTLMRRGSLRQTAIELNISAPAATKILQDLEQSLGAALFERSGRKLHVTAIGRFVAEYARRMVSETERFGAALDVMSSGGYGALSIGAIMVTATDLLPRAIVRMKEMYPLMAISLTESSSDRLLADLERNEFDLVIGRLTQPHHAALFNFLPLNGEKLALFTGRSMDRSFRKKRLSELSSRPWVLQPPNTPTRKLVEETFAHERVPMPADFVETSSIYATLKLVRKAGMISVLPRVVVEDEGTSFVTHPQPIYSDLSDYGIVTLKKTPPSSTAAMFIEMLRKLDTFK